MSVMVLILVAIIVGAVVGICLLNYAKNGGYFGFLAFLFGILILAGSGVGAVSYAFSAWSWIASDHKAAIINREYGTQYTREELFFASDVIDTVRELDRKRIELNGDIFTGKSGSQ